MYMSGKIVNHFCRAPLLGGQFAAWGICFSSFDCTFAHIRGKEVHLGFLVLELILDLFSSSGSLEFHHVWSSCRGSDGCKTRTQEHGKVPDGEIVFTAPYHRWAQLWWVACCWA